MSAITIDIPIELRARLERIAKEYDVSVSDLLLDAARKMSQADDLETIKAAALARDTRSGFERVLSAVPDTNPSNPGDILED